MGRFDGKVAIVTGSGAGIGKASAQLLAREGAKIIVADNSAERGEDTVRAIRETGADATFVSVDVSDAAATERMVLAAIDTYGRLDAVHANAGVNLSGNNLVEDSPEAIARTVSVNLLGALFTCRAAIPQMAKSGGGAIVMTASRTGIRAQARIATYSATKAAVINLAESLALECAPLGIRVNAIAPGITRTEFFQHLSADSPISRYYERLIPLKRWGEPLDIANGVAFLLSDEAAWITGTTLTVDGGQNLRQGDLAVADLMGMSDGVKP